MEGDYHLLNPNLDYISPVFTCTVSFHHKLTIFTTFYLFTQESISRKKHNLKSLRAAWFLFPFSCCYLPRLWAVKSFIFFHLDEKMEWNIQPECHDALTQRQDLLFSASRKCVLLALDNHIRRGLGFCS